MVTGKDSAKFQIQVFLVEGSKEAVPLSTSEGGGRGAMISMRGAFHYPAERAYPTKSSVCLRSQRNHKPGTGLPPSQGSHAGQGAAEIWGSLLEVAVGS